MGRVLADASTQGRYKKTTFATHKELFEWNVMLMGLVNASGSFQQAMNLILHGTTQVSR